CSMRATCRGVNPRLTISRSFVCFGASMLIMLPSHSATSGTMSVIVIVGAEGNVSGSRDTCMTSAYRVTAQNPGPCGMSMPRSAGGVGSSWNDTGRSARSFAKMPSLSGRIHCSMSPSRMSSSGMSVSGRGTVCVTSASLRVVVARRSVVAHAREERRHALVALREQGRCGRVDGFDRPRFVVGVLGDRTPTPKELHLPAHHLDDLSRDPGGEVGGEPARNCRNVLGREAIELTLLGVHEVTCHTLGESGARDRADGVDAHADALEL